MITAEQFQEWKTHPVTREVFTKLEEMKLRIINGMADGDTIVATAEGTQGLTIRAVGQIHGLNQLLNIEFEDQSDIDVSDFSTGY